jgi:hypothetical protein
VTILSGSLNGTWVLEHKGLLNPDGPYWQTPTKIATIQAEFPGFPFNCVPNNADVFLRLFLDTFNEAAYVDITGGGLWWRGTLPIPPANIPPFPEKPKWSLVCCAGFSVNGVSTSSGGIFGGQATVE